MHNVADRVSTERAQQMRYYREEIDPEQEIDRPRGYPAPVRYLLDFKLSQVLDMIAQPLHGRTAIVLCAGSGMDSEHLFRKGLKIVATDLSLDALQRARIRATRYGLHFALVVADAEHLPFRDRAADVTFVHDGLHHLPDPISAVRQMVRASAHVVAIAEPARAPLTRLAVKLGISGDYEDAGNYINRLDRAQLAQAFAAEGASRWTFRQHLIYYQPWTFRIYRLFERKPLLWLFKAMFHLANLIVGRWGNSLKAVAWRE